MEPCMCGAEDCPRCFPGRWPQGVRPGIWNRFGLQHGEEYISLDAYVELYMLVHLATGNMKPLCGKDIETEPLTTMEFGAEVCIYCKHRAVDVNGTDFILLGELIAEEQL